MSAEENEKVLPRQSGSNETGVLQRKLQRAMHEKELLLGEIKILKQQVRIAKETSSKALKAVVNVPANEDGGKAAWDHLMEANMRSGTLACVMCIKTYLIRSLARSFNCWKYKALALVASKRVVMKSSMRSSVISGTSRNSDDDSRRQRLLQAAQSIMGGTASASAPGENRGGSQSTTPSPLKNISRIQPRSSAELLVSRPLYADGGHFDFQSSLRSGSSRYSAPTRSSKSKSPVSLTRSKSKDRASSFTPNYSQATYSSLKMHNSQGPKHSVYKSDNLEQVYRVKENSNRRSLSSDARLGVEQNRAVKSDFHYTHNNSVEYNRRTRIGAAVVDEVSEISGEDSKISSASAADSTTRGRGRSTAPKWTVQQQQLQQQQYRQRQPSNNLTRQQQLHARSQTLRKLPGNADMDPAQMRLLYGSLDENNQKVGRPWRKSLRS